MADREFYIIDSLPSGVTLNIPLFKGQRDQLKPEETEVRIRRIAAVRIQRVIGRIKNLL